MSVREKIREFDRKGEHRRKIHKTMKLLKRFRQKYPFTVDPDAIDGEMYFLTLKDLQLYRMSDYDWMDKDGAILSRLTGFDAYEAVLFRYAELGINNRANQGVVTDLAYTPT